ncbi:MAG: Sec-independent protein translocase protein TatB [Gammaproteobacteria bacterium]|nr:Sec-independent protein translocase protein TatB [Gammaproteobacteria bacterium]
MFDIGFFELLVIAIIGLVIIGPERLPNAVRTTAKWWSRIKHSLANARSELEREIGADDIRREIHNDRVLRELRESRADLENTLSETQKSITENISAEEPKPQQLNAGHSETEDDLVQTTQPEDPDYPEHLHHHGEPALNPQRPQHAVKHEEIKKEENSTPIKQSQDHTDNTKK